MNSSIFIQNWDEEITDNVTGHKIVTIGTDVYELKHCEQCGKWLPVEMFRNSKLYPDRLVPHCKSCAYPSKARKETYPVKLLTREEDTIAKTVGVINGAVKSLLSEINSLKEQNQFLLHQKKDLSHLTEGEIRQVLRSNEIPLRLLFDTISQKKSQYQFFCRDTISGLTTPIKTEAV